MIYRGLRRWIETNHLRTRLLALGRKGPTARMKATGMSRRRARSTRSSPPSPSGCERLLR